ncbi:MAG: replicative DNA helicase [Saprospiraceae bacterium]|nr:replicative DNA helicase [Saprospiraceae bacterium]
MKEKDNYTKKITKKKDSISSVYAGKVPPQAVNLEEAVLGALMLDKDAVALIIDILRPDSFYKDSHKHVYKAICNLFEKSEPIDLLTVNEELKKTGKLELIGGPAQLVELTNRVASSANIEFHARIISQKFIQRELIRTATETIRSSFEDTIDVFDLLDKAEQNLFDITEQNLSRGSLGMSTLMNMAIKKLEEVSKNEEGLTGVPTGFVNLDKVTSGWQPSDLIIIAARPGMGKTAFTMSVARNAAIDFNKGVAFFSLEMSSLQLVNRLISMETEIPSEKLRKGNLEDYEWQQLHAAVDKLSAVPLFIDDTPGISIFELRAKCRRLKMQHDIQMVVVDYLQLMTGGNDNKGNREQEISMISRGLKGLAKELNVPVIALSQLSRAVETRGGSKRPQLSDLRESGAIEQDADIVSFIYRPEYYEILEDEDGNSLKGIGEIIISKHRNGALDSVRLKWDGQYAKFSNLDDDAFTGLDDSSFFDQANTQFSGETFSSKMNAEKEINGIDDVPF